MFNKRYLLWKVAWFYKIKDDSFLWVIVPFWWLIYVGMLHTHNLECVPANWVTTHKACSFNLSSQPTNNNRSDFAFAGKCSGPDVKKEGNRCVQWGGRPDPTPPVCIEKERRKWGGGKKASKQYWLPPPQPSPSWPSPLPPPAASRQPPAALPHRP